MHKRFTFKPPHHNSEGLRLPNAPLPLQKKNSCTISTVKKQKGVTNKNQFFSGT